MDTTETIVPMPLTREEKIQATANAQLAAVIAHFEAQKDAKAANALVEAGLKAQGYDLYEITIQGIADDRMNQIKQRDNMRAANELAKKMYLELTGTEFVE